MRLFLIVLLALFFIMSGCSKEQFELGADLLNGSIVKKSLRFNFKRFKGNGKIRDLVNFLYFEGDTLCFSFVPGKGYDKKQVAAWIIDPGTNKESLVERLDFYPHRIAGFSLVGSVLEDFYKDQLHKPVPRDNFCCKDIPIMVKLKIGSEVFVKQGAFRIEYAE